MIPDSWPRWTCPSCHEPQAGRVEPEDPRCRQCVLAELDERIAQVHPDAVRQRYLRMPIDQRPQADRAEVLRAHGWPPEYFLPFADPPPPGIDPFEEPTAWPRHPADSPDGRKNAVNTRRWRGEPPTCLFIGDVGMGKTLLATALAYLLWVDGRAIAYATTQDLVNAVWRPQRGRPELLTIDVLLIDDVDRGTAGEGWEALWAALDQRYSGRRITIGTANRPLAELYDRNSALADRWRKGLIIPMKGVSRRIA